MRSLKRLAIQRHRRRPHKRGALRMPIVELVEPRLLLSLTPIAPPQQFFTPNTAFAPNDTGGFDPSTYNNNFNTIARYDAATGDTIVAWMGYDAHNVAAGNDNYITVAAFARQPDGSMQLDRRFFGGQSDAMPGGATPTAPAGYTVVELDGGVNFFNPTDIVIDGAGNIDVSFTADVGGVGILQLNSSGVPNTSFGTWANSDGQLDDFATRGFEYLTGGGGGTVEATFQENAISADPFNSDDILVAGTTLNSDGSETPTIWELRSNGGGTNSGQISTVYQLSTNPNSADSDHGFNFIAADPNASTAAAYVTDAHGTIFRLVDNSGTIGLDSGFGSHHGWVDPTSSTPSGFTGWGYGNSFGLAMLNDGDAVIGLAAASSSSSGAVIGRVSSTGAMSWGPSSNGLDLVTFTNFGTNALQMGVDPANDNDIGVTTLKSRTFGGVLILGSNGSYDSLDESTFNSLNPQDSTSSPVFDGDGTLHIAGQDVQDGGDAFSGPFDVEIDSYGGSAAAGPLTVNGDVDGSATDDTIVVEKDPSNSSYLIATVNGTQQSRVPYVDVTGIIVSGLEGNDTISVDSAVTISATLLGGDGNDSITGGGAADSIMGGAGNDTISAADGEADTIDGGTGTDSLASSDAGLDVVTNIP